MHHFSWFLLQEVYIFKKLLNFVCWLEFSYFPECVYQICKFHGGSYLSLSREFALRCNLQIGLIWLLSYLYPFISFSYLVALAKTLSTVFNKCERNEQPSLTQNFRGYDSHFTPSFSIILLVLGLPHKAFIVLRYVASLIPSIMKACWPWSNTFAAPIKMTVWFLSSSLLQVILHLFICEHWI